MLEAIFSSFFVSIPNPTPFFPLWAPLYPLPTLGLRAEKRACTCVVSVNEPPKQQEPAASSLCVVHSPGGAGVEKRQREASSPLLIPPCARARLRNPSQPLTLLVALYLSPVRGPVHPLARVVGHCPRAQERNNRTRQKKAGPSSSASLWRARLRPSPARAPPPSLPRAIASRLPRSGSRARARRSPARS